MTRHGPNWSLAVLVCDLAKAYFTEGETRPLHQKLGKVVTRHSPNCSPVVISNCDPWLKHIYSEVKNH